LIPGVEAVALDVTCDDSCAAASAVAQSTAAVLPGALRGVFVASTSVPLAPAAGGAAQNSRRVGGARGAGSVDPLTAANPLLAGKPQRVMRMAREAFVRENDTGYRHGVAAAVENFCNVAATPESKAGIRAFVDRPRRTVDRGPR
jgi:hypothetical protein